MKVSDIRNPVSEVIQQYKVNDKTTAEAGKQVRNGTVPEEKVSLSDRARDTQRIKQAIDKLPDVREEKVQELKSRIKEGTYSVSGEEIAGKMVREALLDIIA